MKPGKRPDPYTAKAHAEGFPARSVYKLEEIDRRCQLVKPGMRVLDLGAAPGSWSQWISKKVGPRGLVVALDLNPLKVSAPNITAMEVDLFATPPEALAAMGPFDLVVSDIAPHTTGMKDVDAARSEELVARVVEVADATLRKGGSLVAKVFQGAGFVALRDEMRARYDLVRVLKPEASRKQSVEIYLVAQRRKEDPPALPPPPAQSPEPAT